MSGVINQGQWGVCGFVSVLNALAQDGKLRKYYGVSRDQMQQLLAPEIIGYLKFTSSEKPELIRDILSFCKEFGSQYDYGTVDVLIGKIRDSVLANTVIKTNEILVALPPRAMIDYLEVALLLKVQGFGFHYTKANDPSELRKHTNCVVGLGGTGNKSYNDLQHWVYVDGKGALQNWGGKTDLSKGWGAEDLVATYGLTRIVWVIHIL